jgi:hypothetical protein
VAVDDDDARPDAASQATVQPATQRYSIVPPPTAEYPAVRSRSSSSPPPRRSAAAAAAEAARASQMSLMPQAGAADIGGLLDIPTYLRKQSE